MGVGWTGPVDPDEAEPLHGGRVDLNAGGLLLPYSVFDRRRWYGFGDMRGDFGDDPGAFLCDDEQSRGILLESRGFLLGECFG